MSSSSAPSREAAIASCVEALSGADALTGVTQGDLQRLIAAAVRLYAAKVEDGGGFPAVPEGSITATDAMIGTTALLRAANVAVFELGCWQQWAG